MNTLQNNSLLAFNSLENNFDGFDSISKEGNDRAEIAEYTVKSGDTLSEIADMFNVTDNSIIWANNIRNVNSIKEGLTLKIPPVSGVIHKVQKGDTVASIANRYGTTSTKVLEFNALPENAIITIGQTLVVPDGVVKAPVIVASSGNRIGSYNLPEAKGYFVLPTTGYNWGKVHGANGVDVANSCGTPIYAAAEGEIIRSVSSGWNGGYGIYARIKHLNGTETTYGHLSKLLIKLGDHVSKGQLIALMGTTGRSTGCHLHFEIKGAKNPLAR